MLIRKAATTESSTLALKAKYGESGPAATLKYPSVSSGVSFVTVGFEKRSSLIYS